ncbi:MAG: hypothetical protein MO852_13320 [Candidatus Devosia euplotis]|nr:hypothetical protein [Candidatus Devosia euplotis]
MTIVDTKRRGVRRKYAIRPYGRYETWPQIAPDKLGQMQSELSRFVWQPAQGLHDVFEPGDKADIGRRYFIDTTLPRTEPLEKPVILSSVMHAPGWQARPDGTGGGP